MWACEPWNRTWKGNWKAQGKYVQGAVCRLCFKPALWELLLAFTLKFRNAEVKPGCIPLRCLQRHWRIRILDPVKADQEFHVILVFLCVQIHSVFLVSAHLDCCMQLIALFWGGRVGGRGVCLCRIKIWSQDFSERFRGFWISFSFPNAPLSLKRAEELSSENLTTAAFQITCHFGKFKSSFHYWLFRGFSSTRLPLNS